MEEFAERLVDLMPNVFRTRLHPPGRKLEWGSVNNTTAHVPETGRRDTAFRAPIHDDGIGNRLIFRHNLFKHFSG